MSLETKIMPFFLKKRLRKESYKTLVSHGKMDLKTEAKGMQPQKSELHDRKGNYLLRLASLRSGKSAMSLQCDMHRSIEKILCFSGKMSRPQVNYLFFLEFNIAALVSVEKSKKAIIRTVISR